MVVSVPVAKTFFHEGRLVQRGERISLSPVEAAALHYQGFVSLSLGTKKENPAPAVATEVEPVSAPEPEVSPKQKRRYVRRKPYRTRALTAEE